MKRDFYTEDHEFYRATVREFLERSVVPHIERWDEERWIDRDVFRLAAEAGIYALEIPEKFGGAGEHDYRFRMVVCEELARAHASSFALTLALQDEMVLHYLLDVADAEQQARLLPAFARGELIGAIAMTEPGTGSDLRGIKTTAVRDGQDWILNGQKTFITSGIMADFVIVAAATGPKQLSLFLVETGMPGFERGRKLKKLGLPGNDTAELFFDNVRVPAVNVMGEIGRGLHILMDRLPRERLAVSTTAIAVMRAVFDDTVAYCKARNAFGKPIIDNQHIRFELAEMATEIDVAQAYVDRSVLAYTAGELTDIDAAKGKWYLSELEKRVVDRCLQLHGGYGYMMEYPVARAYADVRIHTIYGGTTEIMKEIIGRDLAR